jgi:hypothetical protein
MWRDLDNPGHDRDRDEPELGGRGGSIPIEEAHATSPREALSRDLELPRGEERRRVRGRVRDYRLSGDDSSLLATVGAFRVVPEADLREPGDRSARPQRAVERLREQGLLRSTPYVVGETRTSLLTLTLEGRDVLERHRRPGTEREPQAFHAGISKPREVAHDARLYRAYAATAERLAERGARVRRVVLEGELKGDYQRFLQAGNRDRSESTGQPLRDPQMIADWARERQLPCRDGHVQFPDVRIEYEERDGRRDVEDVEVVTPHYRGAHAAAKGSAGFTTFRAAGARVGGSVSGRGQGARGGRRPGRGLAEELLS